MKFIQCIAVSVCVLLFGSCIEKDVRLYVKIDSSCEKCCKNIKFPVYVSGDIEAVLTTGERALIERELSTSALVKVLILGNEGMEETLEICQECVVPLTSGLSQIGEIMSGYLPADDAGDSDNVYAYYDMIFFENEDMHLNITCSAASN